MTLRLVAGPTEYGVTLAEAKAHLRVDHDDDDALISALIAAAYAHAETRTNRYFATATYERVLDAFPTSEIDLGIGPVASVVSVTYVDSDGATQTVPAEDYEVDIASAVGWVVPSASWPASLSAINAVIVRFTVGGTTPPDIRAAILLIIGLWYDTRASVTSEAMSVVPMAADAILSLHHRFYV